MEKLHKIGKFYTRIILKHIGIFLFVGLLFVFFCDHGGLPEEEIYAISQLVYVVVLPVLIAYEGGRMITGEEGGILAVLAMSGLLVSESAIGILGAMMAGPAAGYIWKYEQRFLKDKMGSCFQMLVKNLAIAVTGGILAVAGYYLISPALQVVTELVYQAVNMLVTRGWIALAGLIIEPAKVFFLNNLTNHAVLVPLGMEQVQETGRSVLFLLEANPGPGFGLMLALSFKQKDRRSEYATAMIAQAIGGIHEVYFPFVLSNLRLLIPLILGGVAGNFCFILLNAGVQGVVSPGSILVILLMAGKEGIFPVLAGIAVSVIVTFVVSLAVFRYTESNVGEQEQKERFMTGQKKIQQIGFVCEGGVGSSAMGAALFRRMLSREGMADVSVEAYAADLVPEETEMVVCQKDYYELLSKELKQKEYYLVESLLKTEEYMDLLDQIKKRNGEKNGIYATH